jgi:hypothetical protein
MTYLICWLLLYSGERFQHDFYGIQRYPVALTCAGGPEGKCMEALSQKL